MQTSALNGAGGQNQLIQQLMELARANAIQEEGAQAASSTGSTQGNSSSTPAATPASGTTPSDLFSGSTLGALTSAQEGGPGYWTQQIDSDVANQIIDQFGSNGGISLSQVQNAIGGSGSATSGSTSSSTPSTLDGLASAFASVDTNGDGELSADELTNALNQMQGDQGSGQVHGHHGHHHHHGGGDGDGGQLSLQDIENALDTLAQALSGSSGSTSSGGSTTSGPTSSNTVSTLDGSSASTGASTTPASTTTTNTASTLDGATPSSVASTSSNPTATSTVSTLDGLTTADIAHALQAFLNSLAQAQAANLNALVQQSNPTSVTA